MSGNSILVLFERRCTGFRLIQIILFMVVWILSSSLGMSQTRLLAQNQQIPAVQQIGQTNQRAVAQDFDLSPGKRVIISDSVFRRGSATLEPQSLGDFDKLARYIQKRQDFEIEIRGHASNEGPRDRNLLLSQQRADAAKAYLVNAYGVSADRIRTRGMGDADSLVPNIDEISRAKNRRVEFLGIGKITGKVLTNDGYLTMLQGKVQTRAPWQLDWQDASQNQPIYEYHRIQTGPASRAEVTFNDQSKLQIGELATIIVYSPSKDRAKDKPQGTVELVRGDLFLKMTGREGINDFSVSTGGKQLTLGQGTARIGVDSNNRASVSVLEGTLKLKNGENNGEDVVIPQNFGTQLGPNAGKSLQRIPDPPMVLSPDTALVGLVPLPPPVSFKWVARTAATRLEIAENEDFLTTLYSQTLQSDSAMPKLKPGVYYFRIMSIDSLGLQSRIIMKRFTVAEDELSFKVVPFVLFLLAVVLFWVSTLFKTPFQQRYMPSFSLRDRTLAIDVINAQQPAIQWFGFANRSIDHQTLIKWLRRVAVVCLIIAFLALLLR
jgi:outer membrane protein OmpA-like peptidoglycan-associated protein